MQTSIGNNAKAHAGEGFVDLGFAKPDLERKQRCGVPEVIYGAGKTTEQIVAITRTLRDAGQEQVLITRVEASKAEEVMRALPDRDASCAHHHEMAQMLTIGEAPKASGHAYVAIAAAGTSDLPVAEEAALTAQWLGSRVERVYDVGVAGIHRLLAHAELLSNASCVVVVAGMEGALASAVGGLVRCPVVAVPTSVGYGANFGGISALLAMLNSCASGVSVVNIDNGFGAGYQAYLIDHVGLAETAS
jgi:NCAIR mutase (PurE)-related protein